MITRKDKIRTTFIKNIQKELSLKLPLVFSETAFKKALHKILQKNRITDEIIITSLSKTVEKVPLKWNTKADYKLLTFNSGKIQIIDILAAFQPLYYLSHFSALYLHELTNQRPEEYFLSKEVMGRTPIHSKEKIPEKIRQAFFKSPRKTSKSLSYQKTKITLLEKQDLEKIGVKKKSLKIEEKRQVNISFTSLERTLIDSIISPHYSGGIKTVINAFFKARININHLYKIYKVYSPYYPYWQSIGFLLYKLKKSDVSKKWLQYFSSPKMEFYLDKNFNENWDYDPKWKMYYPKGLI